jgi:predicted Zn-dependent protease
MLVVQMKKTWMKKGTKGLLLGFALGFALNLTAAAEVTEEERKRQETLALEYRWTIDRTPSDDAAAREALYLRLIDECPETEAAERAHWALSNLYLDDFEEPRESDARKILERFVERYPSSRWVLHVTDRLAWLWGEKRP